MLSLPLSSSVTLDKSFISLDLNDLISKMEKIILFTLKGLIEDRMKQYLGNCVAISKVLQFGSIYSWAP